MKLLLVLMLVVGSVFTHSELSHKCSHDAVEEGRIARGEGYPTIKQNLRVNLLSKHEANLKRSILQSSPDSETKYPRFDPLRILINYDGLFNDTFTCNKTGQIVDLLFSNGTKKSTYTCTEADVLTAKKQDYLLNKLLNYSISMLQSALSVYRPDVLYIEPLPGCIYYRTNKRVTTSNYDFVLFITARPIGEDSTIAYAKACAYDDVNRPIAGYANFSPKYLIDNANDFPRQNGITVHEISHALGFSDWNFRNYRFIKYLGTMTGDSYDYETIDAIESWIDEDGFTRTSIITPAVVGMVQQHFNCTTILGGELEDGGLPGTVSSHWEKRVFMNEYMTGTENNFPVFSNITLALFNDSGWYIANFSVARPLLFGYNWGCDFVERDCGLWTSNPSVPSEGFCNSLPTLQGDSDVHCSFDRRSYGICNMIEYAKMDSRLRHYSNPNWGSTDKLTDLCAYIGGSGSIYCNTGGTSSAFLQSSDSVKFISDSGEQFEMNSRCMFSTLSKVKSGAIEIESFQPVLAPVARSARCYNHTCVSHNDLRIQIDGVWYPCPQLRRTNGKYSITGVFGFGGELECPEPTVLCAGTKPDFTWPQLIRITPTHGPPSTKIIIIGSNFIIDKQYEVIMEVACTNVTVINSTHMSAIIPGNEHFVSVADLAFFQTKKNIIIRDYRGYTDQRGQVFAIEVKFDSFYIKNLFAWMGRNPLAAFIATMIIILPCICCCVILYFSLRKKKKLLEKYKEEEDFPEELYEYESEDDSNENNNNNNNTNNNKAKVLKQKEAKKNLNAFGRISEKVTKLIRSSKQKSKESKNKNSVKDITDATTMDDDYNYGNNNDGAYVRSSKTGDKSGFKVTTSGGNGGKKKSSTSNFWSNRSSNFPTSSTSTNTSERNLTYEEEFSETTTTINDDKNENNNSNTKTDSSVSLESGTQTNSQDQ